MPREVIKVAIVDLYDNEPNQGMRCLKEIVQKSNLRTKDVAVTYSVFETRYKGEVPGLDYDIYLSSGGPGSPFEGEGKVWEKRYFELVERIWDHNQKHEFDRKYIFFICHSFQMMCRFFDLATVRRRHARSFGILPMIKTEPGRHDWLTRNLPETYYAADFRQFEVVQPNCRQLSNLRARVLSREQERRNPQLERALMAIRISEEIVGTQYHPEADPISMLYHFQQPERKQQVVDEHGEDKYYQMIAHLEDPANILLTRKMILPRFLDRAIRCLTAADGSPCGFDPCSENGESTMLSCS